MKAKSIGFSFDVKKIHIDYELAMIKAVKNVFPDSIIQGCLFHYSQCLWRKVQDLGIVSAYNGDSNVRRWIRRFSALPFVPLKTIDDAFLEIYENAPCPSRTITSEQVEKFHDYMVETWVDELDSKFNRNLWNQFDNDGPRTTNNAEGFNHKLNHDAKARLTLFQFVHFLQKTQNNIDKIKFDLISGTPSPRSIKARNVNKSIERAKCNFSRGNVDILHYLDSVSFAIKLG